MRAIMIEWWVFCIVIGFGAFFVKYTFRRSVLSPEKYDSLPEAPLPERGQTVLALIPHPDDETLAVGGYLFGCSEAGAEVRLVLVSDGNRQGLRDQRYCEFRAAAGELGIKTSHLDYWDFPDGQLRFHQADLRARVERELADRRPDWLLYPHPADRHPDHGCLGQAVDDILPMLGREGKSVKAMSYLVHFNFFPEPAVVNGNKNLLPPAVLYSHEEWLKISLSPRAQTAKHKAIEHYRSQLCNPFLRPLFAFMQRPNELVKLSKDVAETDGPQS